MFDIGWSEMAVVLLVALIVIGPKDLPRVARTVGQWVGKGRAMAREFQRALEDMAREAELDKVKSEIEKAGRTDVGKTIEKTIDPSGELSKAFDPKAGSGTRAQGTEPAPAEGAPAAAEPAKPASPAPASNGASTAPAPESAHASPETAQPASRTPAGNGSGTAECTEPTRTSTAPAEPH